MNQPTALTNWVLNLLPSGSVGPTSTSIVVPDKVQLIFAGAPGGSASSVQYLATPPDVVGTNALPVAAFEWFFV